MEAFIALLMRRVPLVEKKKRPDYKVGRILLYLAHTELIFLITSTNQYEKGEHPNRNKSREL